MKIIFENPKSVILPVGTLTINELEVLDVIDSGTNKLIYCTLNILGMRKTVVLYEGEEQYNAVGNWTDEVISNRILELSNDSEWLSKVVSIS